MKKVAINVIGKSLMQQKNCSKISEKIPKMYPKLWNRQNSFYWAKITKHTQLLDYNNCQKNYEISQKVNKIS